MTSRRERSTSRGATQQQQQQPPHLQDSAHYESIPLTSQSDHTSPDLVQHAFPPSHSSTMSGSGSPRRGVLSYTQSPPQPYPSPPSHTTNLHSQPVPKSSPGDDSFDGTTAYSDLPYGGMSVDGGRGGSLDLSEAYVNASSSEGRGRNYDGREERYRDFVFLSSPCLQPNLSFFFPPTSSLLPIRSMTSEANAETLPLFHSQLVSQLHPLQRLQTDSSNSRTPLSAGAPTHPLHPGAQLKTSLPEIITTTNTSNPADPTHLGEFNEKERDRRYRSPPQSRGHSPSPSRGGGLGNWHGPAGAHGRSPYGPLGSSGGQMLGGPHGAGGGLSGANTPLRGASESGLLFAEGDFIKPPSNKFSRFMYAIFDSSFIVRWIIYIVPILGLLWIPGIINLTASKHATVWDVPLKWWSAWLSVVWCGWWGAALVARLGPTVLKNTIGVMAPELRHYILYVQAVSFYTGAAGWGLAIWVTFHPLIRTHAVNDASSSTLGLFTQGLFGIFIVLMILLIEKLVIQIIAHNFHKKSYEDRITEQKFQIGVLVALYLNSHDIGRVDTLDGGYTGRPGNKRQTTDPTLIVKKALHGAKKVAQTATTVIGTVASEIAGERILQPNSPGSMVTNALGSASKTKHLARRIFYSFTPSYRHAMLEEDISRCFKDRDTADRAFAMFDRDSNGDASLEEIEMACMDIHRERLALSNSMRDIDSAVGRLDNIIMGLYYVVAIIIIIGLLDASFNTMIASAGTLILGLSWLIGTTAQEILASIIFLFIKHVYDVGDRVDIDGVSYVVMEMHLLSTIFKRVDGTVVQAPHNVLNTKFVYNVRRSGAIFETITFDVDFATTFEQIEALRARMLEFLENERRDFLPIIDISVKDFEGQGKLTLSTDIRFKSNWQNGALKAQRRNKFICSLKLAMASLEIWGPAGAGNPTPPPADPISYTLISQENHKGEVKEEKKDPKVNDGKDLFKTTEAIRLTDPREIVDDPEGDVYSTSVAGTGGGSEVRKRTNLAP